MIPSKVVELRKEVSIVPSSKFVCSFHRQKQIKRKKNPPKNKIRKIKERDVQSVIVFLESPLKIY